MQTIQTKGLGWRPDFPDIRDRVFPLAKMVSPQKLPDITDLRTAPCGAPPIYDQLALGSCTGNGIAGGIQYQLMRQGSPPLGPSGIPSRLMIYFNERQAEGTISYDSGASIRDGIKAVAQLGVCDESEWPYDISQFATAPPVSCYTDAAHHVVSQYLSVHQEEESLMGTLAAGYYVVFGFTVYESFLTAQVATSGVMPLPDPSENVMGGHCVVLVGYDITRQVWIVRNSWGSSWGKFGYFEMPWQVPLDEDMSDDFWAIEVVGQS